MAIHECALHHKISFRNASSQVVVAVPFPHVLPAGGDLEVLSGNGSRCFLKAVRGEEADVTRMARDLGSKPLQFQL